MAMRELVVLGTASQAPTRQRNHNGYLLRWDDEVLLFDPGEGSQRQMLHTGISATDLTRICVTHFHGDHCLGLPGIIQRLSLDRVPQPVAAHFPAGGAEYFARLRHASSFYETAELRPEPVDADGQRFATGVGTLEARRLRHPIETYGYRLIEPDGFRMLPEKLSEYGIAGPAVGELLRVGHLDVNGRRVTRDEVSASRPGQRFAFVMDTGLCDAVYALAELADLLVIESTFLDSEAALAAEVGHLTAAQAARVAAESGARRLVLTHFSQRYAEPRRFADEAREHFDGDLVIAEDLMTVQVPPRRVASAA
ncbi:ribonuclease Z [Micromonospora globispora]|uniref:Ribonuclease Z n=1 Tax=Micromonospora globispora TaxID=1450148 RepID=A0A317K6M0_9ACTN|nr:ribonuclease Z [Micromonospora globispora]PWU46783.1 ribonuclease Z [Micromonospora globispora]PWU58412.1 ribonuclease Z [Micromonospora globispora]RQW96040.1 ribonuclease Z [Micromonospora globispora]